MKFIRELSKTKKILLAIVLTIFIFSIGFFIYHKFFFVDKVNIYYRVYTKEKGWSSWRKNGQTAGNGKYCIAGFETNLKTSYKSSNVSFATYYDSWSEDYYNAKKQFISKNDSFNGFKMILKGTIKRNNDIYYRVHTKDGWYNWKNYNKSIGSKDNKKCIDAIEVQILPNTTYLDDYLKDYSKNSLESMEF